MAKPHQRRKHAGGCSQPGRKMPDGSYSKCRLHGGNGAIASWKTGKYSAAMLREAGEVAELLGKTRELTDEMWARIVASAGLPHP